MKIVSIYNVLTKGTYTTCRLKNILVVCTRDVYSSDKIYTRNNCFYTLFTA